MNTIKGSISRTASLLFLVLVTTTTLTSAKDIRNTFTWKYSINSNARVTMENYNCNLTIHTWDKGEAELSLSIDAVIRTDEDAEILEKYLKELVFSNSSSSVAFKSRFWDNRNTILNKTTMKLSNGKTVILSSFRMEGELWIPAGCRFELNSKYSQITMEDSSGPLKLNLYNDNFTGGKVSSDIEIADKYSTIELNDTKKIKAALYNSKLNAGNCGNINIESKYSRVNFTSCESLSVNGYNDNYNITKTGDIMFTAKYSDLKTESSGDLNTDIYNGSVTIDNAGDLKIISKYSEYRFSSADHCTITSSYSDKFTAGKLISISVDESKYSKFRIDKLTESVNERNGYNDSFIVSETGNSFRGFTLNGKYIKATLTIPGTTSFRFRASIKYPDLDINEQALKPIIKIVDGSEVKYDAVKGTESDNMPVIEVNGYEMTLKIVEK